MNVGDALAAMLNRVAGAGGEAAMFSELELADWPESAVTLLKAEGLLVKGAPANVVRCPGCEEDCAMPVEVATTSSGNVHAFVVCDQRDDVARVAVARDMLEQWACSLEQVADALARLLGTRRSGHDAASGRCDVGVLKGTKHSAHVVLRIDGALTLGIAGHDLAVEDVLELGGKGLVLERRALLRCVNNPVAAAGDTLSREHRVERLRKRRDELKAAGVRNYNQMLADEEGCSKSAIKQLLAKKKAPNNWLALSLAPKGTVPKKPKTPY